MNTHCCRHLMAAAFLVLFSALRSQAANGTWTGAADNLWTNSANWSVAPFAGYATVESATFDSAGNGHTTLDIANLYSIWGITFDTASVAAYTIGTGGPNVQTLVIGGSGTYYLTAAAANSQLVQAKLQLGGSTQQGSYFIRNENTSQTITFAGDVTSGSGSTPGLKTVSLFGAGGLTFSGNLYKGGATGLALTNGLAGALTLTGSNTLQTLYLAGGGDTLTDIGSGFLGLSNAGGSSLYAFRGGAITGSGKLWLGTSALADNPTSTDYANCYVAAGETLTIYPEITGPGGFEMYAGAGTFVLAGANTFEAHVALNSAGTLSVANIGNKGSLTSNLGQGGIIRYYASGARLLYTGAGETSDRTLRLENNATLEHAGAGTLTFSSDLDVRGTTKTFTLQGSTAGVGVLAGAVSNGTATTSLAKAGTGTWQLAGSNTYAGATAVSAGTLTVTGTSGAIAGSSAVSISSNATLRLANDASSNRGDRLRDGATVSLDGGTLDFSHPGDAASYAETLGALTVTAAGSTLSAAEAADGQASALTLASLSRSGAGTLDFSGAGLGDSDRNRIFIAGQPDGVIGAWATVNGSGVAAYSSVRGVYAGSSAELAARGPSSVIPDDASVYAHITTPGTEGPITLAGSPASRIGALQQDTATAATVDTAGRTFLAGTLAISEGQAGLTIGAVPGDGELTPLGPGAPLALDNASASDLTINAALADSGGSGVLKNGSGGAALAGPVGYTGGTAINAGTLTFAGHAYAQTVSGAVSGAGALAKSGTNTLHLLGANTYSGPTIISAGLVRVNQNSAFGAAAEGTTVADGATLDVGCTPDVGGTRGANGLNMQTEPVTVQGAGLFGQGAIINSSTGSQYLALGKVTLSGDATFSTRSRWDIRDGTFAMNDHAVTKRGADTFSLSQVAVTPGPAGAAAFDVQEGLLRLQRTTDLGGSAANVVRLRSGAAVDFFDLVGAPSWSLLFDGDAFYNIDNSSGITQNYWGGPVTLNGTATLTSDGTYYGGFAGPVSGTGGILKTNGHSFALSCATNTYSGPTRISGGTLYVTHLSNLGQPSSLGQPTTLENGAIHIGSGGADGRLYYTGAGDATDRAIDLSGTTGGAYLSQSGTGVLTYSNITVSVAGAKTLYLVGSTTGVGVVAGTLTNSPGGNLGLNKSGTGSWTLSGNNRYSGSTSVDAGSLAFTGNNILAGSTTVNAGSLSYSGQNVLSNSTSVNGGSVLYTGTNILNGSLTVNSGFATVSGTNGYGSGNIVVGTTNRNGTLTLTPGSSLAGSGDFRIGNPGGYGALFNNGGSILRTESVGDQNFVFGRDLAYGYLNMTGGSVTAGRFQMAGVNVPVTVSRGLARISGGTLTFSEYVLLARNPGCESVLTMDGGTLNHNAASALNFALAFAGGRSEVNLTGGTINNSGHNITVQQNGGPGATGIVNLCSGTLINGLFSIQPNSVANLNFAGGTLKPSAAAAAFIPANFASVYVYGPYGAFTGGAVIDSAGFNVTVPASLRAPPGQGVYAIDLAAQGAGYIGEPYVSIEGGGGAGATAVANLADDGTGSNTYKVASITVTCPGAGYTSVPTVLLKYGGYNVAPAAAGAVTLAANASGGLTKLGAGVLTLTGTNTYAGTTTVADGTLKAGHAGALPTGTRVHFTGGTLDLGGGTFTNSVGGTGVLTNGTLRASLSPGGEGVVATETLALTLRSGASLQLAGTYRADVGAAGTSDRVSVQGDASLAGLSLSLVNPVALDRHYTYTLLTCTGVRAGAFTSANLPDSRWHIAYGTDGAVQLIYATGTQLWVR